MNLQHKELSNGRWHQLSFLEQMANIGSEVERFINWRSKNNAVYSQKAFDRALELLDLTLDDPKNINRLRELFRVREALAGFYFEENKLVSDEEKSWKKYFMHFTYAVRRKH